VNVEFAFGETADERIEIGHGWQHQNRSGRPKWRRLGSHNLAH
jgi:hypothetical protein